MKSNSKLARSTSLGSSLLVKASVAAVFAVVVAGCAGSPDRPEQQLARAETSIEFAEENGAREFAMVALDRARENLRLAQLQADDGDYAEALRLAEKAEIDAELAAAQSNTGKANESLQEILDSIEMLRREVALVDTSEGGQS